MIHWELAHRRLICGSEAFGVIVCTWWGSCRRSWPNMRSCGSLLSKVTPVGPGTGAHCGWWASPHFGHYDRDSKVQAKEVAFCLQRWGWSIDHVDSRRTAHVPIKGGVVHLRLTTFNAFCVKRICNIHCSNSLQFHKTYKLFTDITVRI